jgi:alpha-1,3-rhamnosyl/mannosyltransferase
VVRIRPTVAWLQLAAPIRAQMLGCTTFHATTGRAPLAPRMPVVLTVHDVTPLTHAAWYPVRDRLFVTPWVRASIRRASAIIAVSRATASDIAEAVGQLSAPVRVVGHGVDDAFHQPIGPEARDAERNRYATGRPFWLAVGGLTPRKNPLPLIAGYARATSTLGEGSPDLVIAGPGGPLAPEVRRLVERLGLGDRVRIVGWVPRSRLPALMAAAEAIVCLSLHEGFGLPVAEALAVGTPVVVSRRGALPEVAGGAGLVVEPTAHDLAEALVRLQRESGLRAHLVAEAARRGPGFDWTQVAEATAAVYRLAGRVPLTTDAA